MLFPNPVPSPAGWQLFRWLFDPLTFLDQCTDRWGSTFSLGLVTGLRMTLVADPEAIADVFALDPNRIESGSMNYLLEPLVGLNSLLLLDGNPHRRHRKLLLPPFHGERMTAYGRLICDLTRQQAADWGSQKVIAGRKVTQVITLKTILKAVFGLVDGDRYGQIQVLATKILDLLGSPLTSSLLFLPSLQRDWGPWSPWGYFLKLRHQLDVLLYGEIADRRAEPSHAQPDAAQPGQSPNRGPSDRTDILSLLLAARDEAGQPMSDEEIRDELMTLLLAGHETTATSLAWALWWVTQFPAMGDRIRAEIAELGPDPEPMAIAKLPYLNAFCQETLRIYPVALIGSPRRLLKPTTIGEHDYPAGAIVSPNIYSAHRRPDLYPNPTQFQPERFLERSFSNSEFLTFGGGNRSCIGMAFAQFEMKLVLATLLMDWSVAYAGVVPPRPARRGVTVGPNGALRLRMTRRDRVAPAPVPLPQTVA